MSSSAADPGHHRDREGEPHGRDGFHRVRPTRYPPAQHEPPPPRGRPGGRPGSPLAGPGGGGGRPRPAPPEAPPGRRGRRAAPGRRHPARARHPAPRRGAPLRPRGARTRRAMALRAPGAGPHRHPGRCARGRPVRAGRARGLPGGPGPADPPEAEAQAPHRRRRGAREDHRGGALPPGAHAPAPRGPGRSHGLPEEGRGAAPGGRGGLGCATPPAVRAAEPERVPGRHRPWIPQVMHHLSPTGPGGVALANGCMSSGRWGRRGRGSQGAAEHRRTAATIVDARGSQA